VRHFCAITTDDPKSEGDSGWTLETLRVYLNTRLEEMDRRVVEKFAAVVEAFKEDSRSAKEAILKAEKATETRFDGVNEFRSTLTDQAATFSTKPQLDEFKSLQQSVKDATNSRIDTISTRLDRIEAANMGRHDQIEVSQQATDTNRGKFEFNMTSALSILAILAVVLEAIFGHLGH
jgi:Mg2+ and Co2+ transporter CorA